MEITVRQIVDAQKKLETNIIEVQRGLASIRGNNWREGVEKDNRKSVKVLYETLVELEETNEKFLDYVINDFSFPGTTFYEVMKEEVPDEFIPEI